MRRLFAALAMALALGAPFAVSSCATVQQVQPQSAREAYAAAEIAFIGSIQVANQLYAQGALPPEQAASTLRAFERIAAGLDEARRLIVAGEEVAAAVQIRDVQTILAVVTRELTRIVETRAAGRATP